MDNSVKTACLKLLAYCKGKNWAGFEPYDALNSRIFDALPFLDSKIPRLALTQLLKRSPLDLRPLLFISPTQNPKALALFISALLRVRRAGLGDHEVDIDYLIGRLIALRTPDTPEWLWGYSFPWQTRFVLVPRWAPNLVCTTFVADAMIELFEQRREQRFLDMAASAAEYILRTLYWEKGNVAGFDYPLRGYRNQVHNANFLAADLFCRVYKHTGDSRFLGPALSAARYSVSQQHEDGGWNYGEASSQLWIDNFHTGFNLCALDSINRYLDTDEFEPAVRQGLLFYRSRFFRDDGAVGYYHDRMYPIDAHSFANAIITLVELKRFDGTNVELARKVLSWALEHMWDEKLGYFYYRVLRTCTIRKDYIRWTQAWMLLAMATLLTDLAAERGRPVATIAGTLVSG